MAKKTPASRDRKNRLILETGDDAAVVELEAHNKAVAPADGIDTRSWMRLVRWLR